MEISAGILGLLHYIDGYLYYICTYECIHVNTCERVIPGSRCVGVFQWEWESQSLASAQLNEAQ